MTEEDVELERLRGLFLADLDEAPPGPNDPPPERIWAAVRGELPPDELGEVLDHVAVSTAGTLAWRLAEELAADPEEEPPVRTAPRPARVLRDERWVAAATPPPAGRAQSFPWVSQPAVAAAALLALLGVAALWQARGPGGSVYRGGPEAVELALGVVELPRDAALLGWQGGPPGTRYELRILTEEFSLVLLEEELAEPRHLVPAAALAAIPDGATLLWQVKSVGPDGVSALSPVNRLRLARSAGATGEK